MPSRSNTSLEKKPVSPISRVQRRRIKWQTQLLIFVRSGGRCQFPGCNRYLLEHPLTKSEGNFAELAHIVAFQERGPRGVQAKRPADINDTRNLMLLCPTDHKLIDDHPEKYSRSVLEAYRREHEKRIKHVTDMGPELTTKIVQLKANIRGKTVAIPAEQIIEAVSPRYPDDAECMIDLTTSHGTGKAFLTTARQTINSDLHSLFAPHMTRPTPTNISVFALAPIPVLMYFGSRLSDKVNVGLFQYHRDSKKWAWKRSGPQVRFTTRLRQRGTRKSRVALLLSLSGAIDRKALPRAIDRSFHVYEITLAGRTPGTDFLRTRQNLADFRSSFRRFLDRLQQNHGQVDEVHLFPAVPAPIAIACGHDPLKAHPRLVVYDLDKAGRSFTYQLRIN